jgi:hypothetical protein
MARLASYGWDAFHLYDRHFRKGTQPGVVRHAYASLWTKSQDGKNTIADICMFS